jgi:hypothetical protein
MRGTGGWLATAGRIPGPRRWERGQRLKADPVSTQRGEPLRVSIKEECEGTVNQDSAWAAQRFQIWSHHAPRACADESWAFSSLRHEADQERVTALIG